MTVLDIVKKYLRDNGFDGLAGDDCGCALEDGIAPCESCGIENCVPGRKVPCPGPDECKYANYVHPSSRCPWHMAAAEHLDLADNARLKAEVERLKEYASTLEIDLFASRQRQEKAEAELEQARCRAAVVDACKDTVFIQHIQEHLSPGCEVVCKICGKTAREIIRAAKEK